MVYNTIFSGVCVCVCVCVCACVCGRHNCQFFSVKSPIMAPSSEWLVAPLLIILCSLPQSSSQRTHACCTLFTNPHPHHSSSSFYFFVLLILLFKMSFFGRKLKNDAETIPIEEYNRTAPADSANQDNHEQESQFILRLPSLPAASLKAAVKSGVLNLKDRLSIQIEPDMRKGAVRFDGWVMPARIMDLPTIIESHKTLDNKNFYKTADICQIMICKEESDDPVIAAKEAEAAALAESEVKKTKDGKDKRYLFPHGITKPLKNVRKKRFRKTLRKKYVDFPEIEKEVKRLLRFDNECKSVRYEIVNIDEDGSTTTTTTTTTTTAANTSSSKAGIDGAGGSKMIDSMHNENEETNHSDSNRMGKPAYDDLFGDVVSSSDDDDNDDNEDDDDSSRLSAGIGSRFKMDSSGVAVDDSSKADDEFHSFAQISTLRRPQQAKSIAPNSDMINMDSNERIEMLQQQQRIVDQAAEGKEAADEIEDEAMQLKVAELEAEIQSIHSQRVAQQLELDSIENMALKQRFQAIIDDLKSQETMKRRELEEFKLLSGR